MKASRLLSDAHVADILRQDPRPHVAAELSTRCTGRTTALALETISRAMLQPGLPMTIPVEANTKERRDEVARKIAYLLNKLGLQHFMLRAATLTYDIYKEISDEREESNRT